VAGGGTGSVTSVALTVPSFLSVSGSPITGAGTLAVSLATQGANLIFAGPGSGSAAAPTFRSLVAADIPNIAESQVMSLVSDLAAKAALASPTFTGTPAAPTAAVDTNTTQLATTAFVLAQASASGDGTPAMDGTAARGTSTHFTRADHVHPTDTSRAPLTSPAFTGTPTAPTVSSATDSSTKLATTAFVQAALVAYTAPISNDGSGHYWIGGSSAIQVLVQNSSFVSATLSVNGLFAVNGAGQCQIINNEAYNSDVLIIQHNGTQGQSSIDFQASKDAISGIVANAVYGAIGFDPIAGSYPAAQMMYLSFSNPFELTSGGIVIHDGTGQFALVQETSSGSGSILKQRRALAFLSDSSVQMTDYDANQQFRMFTQGNSGYYDTDLTQVDSSNHRWGGSPQGVTWRLNTHESKECFLSIRSSNFSASGLEAMGPSKGCVGSNSSNGFSLTAHGSGAPLMFYTSGLAAANERLRIDGAGNFIASNVVTADLSATLANSQYQFTVYDNSGTAVFKIRYKDASGTVKTGTVALS